MFGQTNIGARLMAYPNKTQQYVEIKWVPIRSYGKLHYPNNSSCCQMTNWKGQCVLAVQVFCSESVNWFGKSLFQKPQYIDKKRSKIN